MASGNAIIAMDTPENREVLADAGMYFEISQSWRAGLCYCLRTYLFAPHTATAQRSEQPSFTIGSALRTNM